MGSSVRLLITTFTNFNIKQEKNMNFVHLLLFSFILLVSLHLAEGGQSISGDDLNRPRTGKNGFCDSPRQRGPVSFNCRACCDKCRHNYRRPSCEKKCCAVCDLWQFKPEE